MAKLSSVSAGLQNLKLDGTNKVASVYASEKTGYKYITIVDESQLLSSVNDMRIVLVIVLLVALVMILGTTYWLSNTIVRPLSALEAAAGRIAEGDLCNVDIQVDTEDEIGRLAASFHKMTIQLKHLLEQIQASANEVSSSSVQLSSGAEQCSETITHDRYELYGYSLGEEDAAADRFRQGADHWCRLGPLALEDGAEKIQRDGIDILVDLSGHSDGGLTLALMAHKPAPVQISAIGWVDTTGMVPMGIA